MKKFITKMLCALLLTMLFSLSVHAQWTITGSGTAGSPFLITSAAELKYLADSVATGQVFEEKYFELANDIDLIAYSTETGWPSIGTSTTSTFQGSFDGKNHKIFNLKTNRTTITGTNPNGFYVSLFGVIGAKGYIKNLGIVNSQIVGSRFVGGLAGLNNGTIENCYVTGTVTGQNYTQSAGQRIGGLVGENVGSITDSYTDIIVVASGSYVGGLVGNNVNTVAHSISKCYTLGNITATASDYVGGLLGINGSSGFVDNNVINCYSTANVTGRTYVGGLIGQNYRNVSNCYASGTITGTTDNVGGLIGRNNQASLTVKNCVAANDTIIGKTANTGRVIGSNTAGALNTNFALSSMIVTRNGTAYIPTSSANGLDGLDKTTENLQTQATYATDLNWDFTTIWKMPTSAGFPVLRAASSGQVFPFASGNGTQESPYVISEPIHLDSVRNYLSSYFILSNDIDLVGYTGEGWVPIGSSAKPFKGKLNGKGFKIKNLYINRVADNQGLFANTASECIIDSLGIENCDITGQAMVGGFSGNNNSGVIKNSFVTGKIVATGTNSGGMIGANIVGQITNCYSICQVTGSGHYVGGLIGDNFSGTITSCYSKSTIIGSGQQTGGLCGASDGSVLDCFAEGKVTSSGDFVGGLIGLNEGDITNCYATTNVYGKANIGGLAGSNQGSNISKCYAIGTIMATGQYVGGIVGRNYSGSKIEYCAAVNDTIKGSGNAGRITGVQSGTLGNNYAYAAMAVSSNGGSSYEAVTGGTVENQNGSDKTISELQQENTYKNTLTWSFINKWMIWENNSFPYFVSQSAPITIVKNTIIEFWGTYRTSGNNPISHIEISDDNGLLGMATLASGTWIYTFDAAQPGRVIHVTSWETGKIASYTVSTVLQPAEPLVCNAPQNVAATLHENGWYNVKLAWDKPSTAGKSRSSVYDNGPFITAYGVGLNGADISVRATGSMINGGEITKNSGKSIADDFVLETETEISHIEFYGYHTGFTDTLVSPFEAVFVKIFDVKPTVSSVPIWGDFTTNRLTSSSFSRVYRLLNTDAPTAATRPVFTIRIDVDTTFSAGTYWVEITANRKGTNVSNIPFVVPVTIEGQSDFGNGIYRNTAVAPYENWKDLNGTGGNQALTFTIHGNAVSDPILGYNVYKNGVKLNETLLTECVFTETAATGSYNYEVSAMWEGNCESEKIPVMVIMEQNPCEIAVNTFPFTEGFEGGALPACWQQIYEQDQQSWEYRAGAYGGTNPNGAHSGSYNAYLYKAGDATTKLVTPMLDLSAVASPILTFFHGQGNLLSQHDELRVYYKNSPTGSWIELASYTQLLEVWTKSEMDLPNPTATYWIAFEGKVRGGRGVVLDNVSIISGACEGIGNLAAQLHNPSWYNVNLSWNSSPGKLSKDAAELFNNGPLITTVGGGYNGKDISAVNTQNGKFGEIVQKNIGVGVESSMADDFTLAETSYIDYINFYAFHYHNSTTSTITEAFVQIYNDAPNAGGQLVWGDTYTNVLSSADFSDIYRTPATIPLDDNRPIFVIKANINTNLPAGTYWVNVTYTADVSYRSWVPPVTTESPSTGNAIVFQKTAGSDGSWKEWKGGSYTLGMPFSVYGMVGENPVLGYNVYCDNVLLNANPTSSTSFLNLVPQAGTYSYGVTKVWRSGCESEKTTITVNMPTDPCASAWNTFPIEEGFEGGVIPTCWHVENVVGATGWSVIAANLACPSTAYSGNYKVAMRYNPSAGGIGAKAKLITPMMDITQIPNPNLSFQHAQCILGGSQDTLAVYYKNSEAGAWILIHKYTAPIENWEAANILLPNPTATYWIAFEGIIGNGEGVVLDNVVIKAGALLPPTNFAVTMSGVVLCSAGLSWTPPITGTISYNVYRDNTKIASNISATSFTDESVSGTHEWCVTAVYGVSESARVCATETCAIPTYTITALASVGGTITPTGTISVVYGNDRTFTFTSFTGYQLKEVLVDGTNLPEAVAAGNYTFENVTSNHTIVANFEKIPFVISATAEANGTISPAGDVTVLYGENQTFTVMANSGYAIHEVLVDGVNVPAAVYSGSYTFINVRAAHTITATFVTAAYTITATAGANGTISPSGVIGAGHGGSQQFFIVPNAGYAIAQVLVDGSPNSEAMSGVYTFTNISASHTIAATFEYSYSTITATADEGGTIAPAGASQVSYGGSKFYSITPNVGYKIAQVLVDGAPNAVAVETGTYLFTNVTTSHSIHATFTYKSYDISASCNEGGTISPEGTITLNYGGSQVYTITTATGYTLTQVLVDGVSIGTPTTYTFSNVMDNHSIRAIFEIKKYDITATAGAGGTIFPTGITTVNYGGEKAYSFHANEGYKLKEVLVDGANNAAAVTSGTYTFSNVTANHTIAANFEAIQFTVTASIEGANGSITPTGAQTVNYGGEISFTITPNEGYLIDKVLVDGINRPGAAASGEFAFSGVMKDHTITASFTPKTNINEGDITSLTVYPNPTTGELKIMNGELRMNTILVFDIAGKLLMERNNVDNTQTTIDLSDFASGIYFLRIDGKVVKVVKQ